MLKESLDDSYHVQMLIELLLHFPDIYTITFDVPSSTCRLTYMVKRPLQQGECAGLRKRLQKHLEVFRFLRGGEQSCSFRMSKHPYPGITRIQITLKGDSLLEEVIGLFTKVFRDHFKTELVGEIRDRGSSLAAAASPLEEAHRRFPSAVPSRRLGQFFAFRDAGKVYVFDK